MNLHDAHGADKSMKAMVAEEKSTETWRVLEESTHFVSFAAPQCGLALDDLEEMQIFDLECICGQLDVKNRYTFVVCRKTGYKRPIDFVAYANKNRALRAAPKP